MQGNIGLLQDIIHAVLPVPEDRDPDAGAAEAFSVIEQVGLANRSQDFLADGLGLGRGLLGNFAQVFEHHDKLITAQSRHGVGVADARGKAPGEFLKEIIACLMAEGLVQHLEIIQIDQQQRLRAVPLGAGGQGLTQPVHQKTAVGKACQRVVKSEIADGVLRRLGSGHIPRDGNDAGNAVKLNPRCRYKRRENLAVFSSKVGL